MLHFLEELCPCFATCWRRFGLGALLHRRHRGSHRRRHRWKEGKDYIFVYPAAPDSSDWDSDFESEPPSPAPPPRPIRRTLSVQQLVDAVGTTHSAGINRSARVRLILRCQILQCQPCGQEQHLYSPRMSNCFHSYLDNLNALFILNVLGSS